MKDLVSFEEARDYAFRSLAANEQTESQMRTKLERRNCPPEIIERVMRLLKEYRFIDDARYMEEYVATHCHRLNRQKIKERFYARGLKNPENLDALLEEFDYDEEKLLDRDFEKYCRTHDREKILADPNGKRKMISFFLRRGYSYSSVLKHMQDAGC